MKYVPMIHRKWRHEDIAWYGDEKPATVETTMTVYEREYRPEDTGLLDSNGTPLYRVPDKRRIGYL